VDPFANIAHGCNSGDKRQMALNTEAIMWLAEAWLWAD